MRGRLSAVLALALASVAGGAGAATVTFDYVGADFVCVPESGACAAGATSPGVRGQMVVDTAYLPGGLAGSSFSLSRSESLELNEEGIPFPVRTESAAVNGHATSDTSFLKSLRLIFPDGNALDIDRLGTPGAPDFTSGVSARFAFDSRGNVRDWDLGSFWGFVSLASRTGEDVIGDFVGPRYVAGPGTWTASGVPPAPVPLPAGALLLVSAFGLAALALRRRA